MLQRYATRPLARSISILRCKKNWNFSVNFERHLIGKTIAHFVRQNEKPEGTPDKQEFQAETIILLVIVACSLHRLHAFKDPVVHYIRYICKSNRIQ